MDDSLLASRIEDIMNDQLYIEEIPYSSDEYAKEISGQSRQFAAQKIVEFLKNENLLKDGK